MKSSRIPDFYKMPFKERLRTVSELAGLAEEEVRLLEETGGLPVETAERMIENVIGVMPIPLGVACNFMINGRDYLIPMAIEEPSVVAAASNAARMVRESGGFHAEASDPVMIGQIQVTDVEDPYRARFDILKWKGRIIAEANSCDPVLTSLGGGVRELTVRVVEAKGRPFLVAELHVDCRDAMGANVINTMSEAVAPLIEQATGGKVVLRIVSNLAVERLARAKAVVRSEVLGGDEVVERIIRAYELATADVFRCATHNKGIMNGIVAVANATGNDTRALEAGAHAYASLRGRYMPLTVWEKTSKGDLAGTIELPIAVGLIGGATATHPVAKISRKILGVSSATELAEVMAAVGLAQNLAALRALATEGIQRGHMRLHARNIASMAGAVGDEIDEVAAAIAKEGRVRLDRAREVLEEVRRKAAGHLA
ncbi:MAG: hydroxymethylglutaryl-CoA reductase, degradative [Candidatus Bathyarchaeia archaeon]